MPGHGKLEEEEELLSNMSLRQIIRNLPTSILLKLTLAMMGFTASDFSSKSQSILS